VRVGVLSTARIVKAALLVPSHAVEGVEVPTIAARPCGRIRAPAAHSQHGHCRAVAVVAAGSDRVVIEAYCSHYHPLQRRLDDGVVECWPDDR
jgi:hypothetical protein